MLHDSMTLKCGSRAFYPVTSPPRLTRFLARIIMTSIPFLAIVNFLASRPRQEDYFGRTASQGAAMDGSSAKTSPQGYVTIHGHFYQPPRENPWIEQIEVEPSASPFHDWNTRITAECYRPNGVARIYDGQGRILDIVNNYRYLSFNFGPTLISWLEDHAPDTYAKLLEGDAQSLAALGNGNAIAQAYNHAILPLATARDRETQVIWGLKDFEHRFKRKASALWLPETAVNYPTLATLVDHGLKFVLLSPYQAKRVRPLTGGDWTPALGSVDPTQAYRCFLPDGEGGKRRSIDVFFYNGGVAADLSFGDLLADSYRLVTRLADGLSMDKKRPQLLHVATDGENYGHHKKFGELALAHALTQVLPQKGLQLTNYATFLELAPPTMEVELYLGSAGEGSSWSCSHGVGRWKENCGCSTGGQPTWNQRWRAPLRESFDFLNEKLAAIFTAEGAKYFQDPWQARNAYIDVILDRSNGVLDEFFAQHGTANLQEADRVAALRLLEMERHSLLMYTSCGWFFADISGLESLQVIKYAARALQLGQHFTSEPLEPPFLKILERGVSNIPKEGNGLTIYQERIRPAVVDYPKVANQWVISWLKDRKRQCPSHIYHYRAEAADLEEKTQGSLQFAAGRLHLTSGITRQTRTLAFFTAFLGSYLYRTQVQPQPSPQEFLTLRDEFFRVLESTPEDLIPLMVRRLGETYYSLHDIFQEEKLQVFHDLLRPHQEEAVDLVAHSFGESRPLLKAMATEGLPMPRLFRALGEITLNRRLVELLRRMEPEPASLSTSEEILEVIADAQLMELKLETHEGAAILGRILQRHLRDLAETFQTETVTRLGDFLSFVGHIPLTLELTEAQNFLFDLMRERFPAVAARAGQDPKALTLAKQLVALVEAMKFSPVRYMKLLT
jgi:alpha-amylase/alpha-mannosidase (GH57 family)